MTELQNQQLRCRREQGILVLTPIAADLHGEELAETLLRELTAAVAGVESPRVVLDFQGVKYISSLGLQALLNFRRHLREKGGQLLLCGLCPDVAEVFFTTRLVSPTPSTIIPFGMAPDVPTAVANLTKTISQK